MSRFRARKMGRSSSPGSSLTTSNQSLLRSQVEATRKVSPSMLISSARVPGYAVSGTMVFPSESFPNRGLVCRTL